MDVAGLLDSRILIVDDQAANLNAMTAVLEAAGYSSVRCLSDSREVLRVFADFEPDLIVLDLHMPHVDGLGVMDQLAGVIHEDDYLPVLVLTGDGTSEAKERALARGAHDFLSKPLNKTELQLRIKNLLETRCLHRQLKTQNASLEDTNRKLRETQAHLIQSEKMASLGQLVAGIAHEINNPLAFVLNNIFLIQEALVRLVAEASECVSAEALPKVEKALTRVIDVRKGAERVKDLVLKLRMFSRLDEGKFKTIHIHDSIESVLLLLKHKTEGRIEVERHYGAPDNLSCFAVDLNQVFMNVIGNAVDSIEGRGEITLTTTEENGAFVLRVRDTGKGIPEEIRNRVFEPFFTTKPVGSGTGLGLAVSYGIVKAHKGSIEFASESGKGTEFVVKIPTSLKDDMEYDDTSEAAVTSYQ